MGEKDQQLLELVLRNASILEARINKIIELTNATDENLRMNLSIEDLELVHSLKEGSKPETAKEEEPGETKPPVVSSSSKIVIHADPEIADLIPKFLENRLKDIEAIREALERGDFEAVRTLGHMMKGAGGGYGFPGITEIGKQLEEAAKNGDTQEIGRSVEALTDYMNSVEVIYDEL